MTVTDFDMRVPKVRGLLGHRDRLEQTQNTACAAQQGFDVNYEVNWSAPNFSFI
jgi:hypothetical protein